VLVVGDGAVVPKINPSEGTGAAKLPKNASAGGAAAILLAAEESN
jgi:hypothetical protein